MLDSPGSELYFCRKTLGLQVQRSELQAKRPKFQVQRLEGEGWRAIAPVQKLEVAASKSRLAVIKPNMEDFLSSKPGYLLRRYL